MNKRVIFKPSIVVLTAGLMVLLSACQAADAKNSNQKNDSFSCTLNLEIDIDTVKQHATDYPIIRVRPHNITAEEGRNFAELLLGHAQFYETSFSPVIAKATIQEKILKLEHLNNDETIIDIYGNSHLQSVRNLLQETIIGYKSTVHFGNEENTRMPCNWEWHPQSYYSPMGATANDDDGNSVIMAYVENGDNVSHKLWITTRDQPDYRIQNIYIYPNSEYASPLDIETLYMIRTLCGYQKPTDAEVEHVVEEANKMVKEVEIGEWAIIDTKVEEYKFWRNSEKPVYVINVTAVPSFDGMNMLHVSQLETLKGDSVNISNYYYSEMILSFSPSGALIEATLTSPIDTISSVKTNATEMLDLQQTIDSFTANKENWGVETLRSNGFFDNEDYCIHAIIKDAEYGLARIKATDGSSDFYLMPAVQFSGDYSIMLNDKSIFTYSDVHGEDYRFAPIYLVDEGIIDTEFTIVGGPDSFNTITKVMPQSEGTAILCPPGVTPVVEERSPTINFYSGELISFHNGDYLAFDPPDWERESYSVLFSMIPVEGYKNGQDVSYGYLVDDSFVQEGNCKLTDGEEIFFVLPHQGGTEDFKYHMAIKNSSADPIYIKKITIR